MTINETEVLRYVDKAMTAKELCEFEKKMSNDTSLCKAVKCMQQSHLPYKAAMSMKTCEMPSSLEKFFEENCALYQVAQSPYKKPNFTLRHLAMTAGLAAVCFCAGFVSQSTLFRSVSDGHITLSNYGVPAKLFESMVNYQALNTRMTVAPVNQTIDTAEELTKAYNLTYKTQVQIPNLSQHGYKFKEVKELSYKDKKVLHFVYLPTQGDPIAVCVTLKSEDSTAMPATSKSIINHDELNTVIWHNTHKVVYMLIGKMREEKLMPIAKTLSI